MENIGEIVLDFERKLTNIISKFENRNPIHALNGVLAVVYGQKYIDELLENRGSNKPQDEHIAVKGISSDEDAEEVHSRISELISRKRYPIKETGWYKAGDLCWRFNFSFSYIS